MNIPTILGNGLKKQSFDIRDFSRHKKFGSIHPLKLPDSLNRPDPPLRNQGNTLFCTGYTATAMRGAKYNTLFSPDWFVAQEHLLQGNKGKFQGAGLREQAKTILKSGVLFQDIAKLKWQEQGEDYVADPRNWDDYLIEVGKTYAPNYFMSCDGPYDTYDNIRNAIFLHDEDGEGVSAGLKWFGGDWNNLENKSVVPLPKTKSFTFHNIRIYDWNSLGLIGETNIGKLYIFPREIVNRYFYTKEGPYLFLDDQEPEDIKNEQWGIVEKIFDFIVKLLK